MLIDSHMHIYSQRFRPDPLTWRSTLWNSRRTYPYRDPHKMIRTAKKEAEEMWGDDDGKRWAKFYEELGIDISINLPVDWGLAFGEEAEGSVEEMNKHDCLLARDVYPGKLYSFIGVDPRRHNAVTLLEKGVKEWGAKGLKLIPHMGFYPNDRDCYRLYGKCAELGVPVCIHTGVGVFLPIKYDFPVYLDEPAYDFPEVEFIAAHAGGGIGYFWEEMIAVARYHHNIHFDISSWPTTVIKGGTRGNRGKYKDHIPMFLDILDIWRNLLIGGCLNILFGTDFPFEPHEVTRAWVDLFKNLPEIAERYDYDFSQDEVDNMCYKNAVRIMKLEIEK